MDNDINKIDLSNIDIDTLRKDIKDILIEDNELVIKAIDGMSDNALIKMWIDDFGFMLGDYVKSDKSR